MKLLDRRIEKLESKAGKINQESLFITFHPINPDGQCVAKGYTCERMSMMDGELLDDFINRCDLALPTGTYQVNPIVEGNTDGRRPITHNA